VRAEIGDDHRDAVDDRVAPLALHAAQNALAYVVAVASEDALELEGIDLVAAVAARAAAEAEQGQDGRQVDAHARA
jgi:hypothetical protein